MGNLEPGCLAVIIESVDGHAVGKIVQCIKIVGEHSKYGIVWSVRSSQPLVTEYGGIRHEVDVPAKWLKKIEPGDGYITEKKKTLVTDKI